MQFACLRNNLQNMFMKSVQYIHIYKSIFGYEKLKIKSDVTKLDSADSRTNLSRIYLSMDRIAYQAGSKDISSHWYLLKNVTKQYIYFFFSITEMSSIIQLNSERTFDADRSMVMYMTNFDKVAWIAQSARIQTLLIYAGQLNGTIVVRCAFHV